MFIHKDLISVSFRCNLFYIFVNTQYFAFLWFHNAVKILIVWWHLHICNSNFWGASVYHPMQQLSRASIALVENSLMYSTTLQLYVLYSYSACIISVKIFICVWHSLRLNADVADKSSQKSLRQFCKYCWWNLNYGKIYIFISNTFSM